MSDRVPGWEKRAEQRQAANVRAAQLLGQIEAHLGGILTAVKAPPVGDVLASGRITIPASGIFSRSWPVAFSAVEVDAGAATGPVFVSGGTPATDTPTLTNFVGPNKFALAKGEWRVMNMRDSDLFLLGNAGDVLEVTVYARPREPASVDSSVPMPVVVSLPNPAAGFDWSWTSPSYPVQVTTAYAQLTTDAVVANRFVHLQLATPLGGLMMRTNQYTAIAASSVGQFSWGIGMYRAASAAGSQDALPEMWLPPGSFVQSSTGGLDAGDQWSGVILTYVAGPC